MNFKRLIEDGECGQSNQLLKLAGHTTRDVAFQETVNRFSTSGHTQNHQMLPQSFRMDALMQEIDSEIPKIPVTINQFGNGTGATEYQGEIVPGHVQTTQNQVWTEINFAQENSPVLLDPWGNTASASHYPSYNYNFDLPIQYPDCFQQPHSEQLSNQEILKIQKEIEESQKEFLAASAESDSGSVDIINKCLNESKANQSEDVKIVDDDKENVLKQDEIWSDPVMFIKFINEYTRKGTIWKKNQEQIAELFMSEFQCMHDGNRLPTSTDLLNRGLRAFNIRNFSEAVLWFKEAVRKSPKSLTPASLLFESLCRANSDSSELISAANQFFKVKPDNLHRHILWEHAYHLNNNPYQTCQSLVNWLKNQKKFCDIVPPSFKMEDKDTDKLDDEVLHSVVKMFTKAAQRNPVTPDYQVQYSLGVLCQLSGDYDKAVDCQRIVSSGYLNYVDVKIHLGMYLFYANKPHEAIRVFEKIAESQNFKYVEAYIKIGCTYMYLKDYENAVLSFNKAFGRSSGEYFQVVKAWLATCHDLLGNDE